MLNLTMKQEDDVLLYAKDTGHLMGVITCDRTGGSKPASLQFRVTDNILVIRRALVERITNSIDKCPADLLKRFGGETKH